MTANPIEPLAKTNPHANQTLMSLAQAASRGVFISYSRADELFALELAERLRSLCAVKVWLDITDIPEASDWRTEIRSALERCGVMLYVWPSTEEDRDQYLERRAFRKSDKIIIPILHATSSVTAAQSQLSAINLRESWHDLRRLCRYLSASQS